MPKEDYETQRKTQQKLFVRLLQELTIPSYMLNRESTADLEARQLTESKVNELLERKERRSQYQLYRIDPDTGDNIFIKK